MITIDCFVDCNYGRNKHFRGYFRHTKVAIQKSLKLIAAYVL